MSGGAAYKIAARKVVISASVALATMLVDAGFLMRDEIKYIWPQLRSSWSARGYVLARYMGLLCQIFNVYFSVRMYLGVYTSPDGCRIWFLYQAGVVQSLLIYVEILLMRRIYALFLKSRLIMLVLGSFGAAQAASMIVSVRLSFPSNKYTLSCWMTRSNPGNAFFSATTMTTNLIVFFMTFWRYFALPTNFTRESLGRTVIRDSAASLGAISVIMLFLTLCSVEVIKPSMSGNVTFCWLVCTLWVSIGRIILNHEKIPKEDRNTNATWRGTVQLTSQIEMGESTLTVDSQCVSTEGATSRTLQGSLSLKTKGSQLTPSNASASSGPKLEYLGGVSSSASASGSVPGMSQAPSSTCCSDASDGGVSQPEGHAQAEADVPESGRSSGFPSRSDTHDGASSVAGEGYPRAEADIAEHEQRSSCVEPADTASIQASEPDANQPSSSSPPSLPTLS